jgi:hypothetical protein
MAESPVPVGELEADSAAVWRPWCVEPMDWAVEIGEGLRMRMRSCASWRLCRDSDEGEESARRMSCNDHGMHPRTG